MENDKLRNLVRLVIIGAAIAMIAYGISVGEPDIVLRKPVKVCLECIGLG